MEKEVFEGVKGEIFFISDLVYSKIVVTLGYTWA